jgi:hypothetical protein
MAEISSVDFEQMVCRWTGGSFIRTPCDIRSANQTRLEAKVSNARSTQPERADGRLRCHWTWLRGRKGTKGKDDYQRLILGANFYRELVLFDIPVEWILEFTATDPWKELYCSDRFGYYNTSSVAGDLWHYFLSTPAQLLQRYG